MSAKLFPLDNVTERRYSTGMETRKLKSTDRLLKNWPPAARKAAWYVVSGGRLPVVIGEPCATRKRAELLRREIAANERAAIEGI